MVRFIVTDKGEVIQPEIVRSVSPSLDKEALRVVSKMPAWNPGRNGNKNVATKYTLPVNFSLGSKQNIYRCKVQYSLMVYNAGMHNILCVPVFFWFFTLMCGWLPMLASNNKFVPHRQQIAWYLVLRTIGVYHQHHMCGVLARYVRSISTTAKACKLGGIMFIIMNIE